MKFSWPQLWDKKLTLTSNKLVLSFKWLSNFVKGRFNKLVEALKWILKGSGEISFISTIYYKNRLVKHYVL